MRVGYAAVLAILLSTSVVSRSAEEAVELVAARQARDGADVTQLQQYIQATSKEASAKNSAELYERLALFNYWLCEAGHDQQDERIVKRAAQDGVSAAEKAIALNSNSSESHRLLSSLLGELIPLAFAGGMRYGKRASEEADKAIKLDPANPSAYITRALNYFFTPAMFGGNRDKAIEMLKKASELDPKSDTAHIWLAQVYLAAERREEALNEINAAGRLNPNRAMQKYVYKKVATHAGAR
jgi:tetratricopeptide (TPR) repeat protein